ncbi:C69 family dipeptidase [Aquirufa sp. ROCK2-A2]
MCDTLFSPAHLNLHGHAILAKNSDREPNEAQQIVRIPATKRLNKNVQTTFINIDCPEDVFEVILSKPFQMWGAEMGANEHAVAIGNEAVFTKIKLPKKNQGLTGMDMLRLALEQSKTALDAISLIKYLLATYGQDACGGYQDKGMFYSNSFLIADPSSAYILETAGYFWVQKKVDSYTSISNILTIGTDFDDIHPDAMEFAYQKKWASRNDNFNFQKAFSEPIMSFLGKGSQRKFQCDQQGVLASTSVKFELKDAMSILRSHKSGLNFEPCNGDMGSICLHAQGLLTPSQTTGSMVAELRDKAPSTIWLTGSAAPCLSVFKPFYVGTKVLNEENFVCPSAKKDRSYWWQWEELHRQALQNYQPIHDEICSFQEKSEADWIEKDLQWVQEKDQTQLEKFSQENLDDTKRLLIELKEKFKNLPSKHKGHLYQLYWNWQNKKA